MPGAAQEGVGAFAEPTRQRIVLPIDDPPDLLYRLIVHELTHQFEFDIIPTSLIRRSVPLWMNEGLSDYMTGIWQPLDLASIRDAAISDNRYSRGHRWHFDGGVEVPASSSPHVVPLPYSVQAAVDPEEAFVASLSSCHMLWFLSLAAKAGYVVDSYRDEATGVMNRNAEGRMAMTRVTLRPGVRFGGAAPNSEQLEALHHEAHAQCFIANSVKTEVLCEPVTEPNR